MILFLSVPTKNVPTENFGEISICKKLFLLAKIDLYYFKSFCKIAKKFQKNISQYIFTENFYNWIILKKTFLNFVCFYRKVSLSFCRKLFLWSYFFLYWFKMLTKKIWVTYLSAESCRLAKNYHYYFKSFCEIANPFLGSRARFLRFLQAWWEES